LPVPFYPWHVGITVKGYTVRHQFLGFFDGKNYVFLFLKRQTENQVVTHRGVANFTCSFRHPLYICKRLEPVDCHLNGRIIVLYTIANAGKAAFKKSEQMISFRIVGVPLKTERRVFGNGGILKNSV